jgi:hypothetical protein
MSNHWRDPSFKYVPAAAHNDVRAFHRRQQERKKRVLAAAVAKVQPIRKVVAK